MDIFSKVESFIIDVRPDSLWTRFSFSAYSVVGILEDGVFYYSAYVHDYVRTPKGQFIDGGVYYTRSSGKTVTMILDPKGPRIERNDHATIEEGETPEGRLPAGEAQAEEAASDV